MCLTKRPGPFKMLKPRDQGIGESLLNSENLGDGFGSSKVVKRVGRVCKRGSSNQLACSRFDQPESEFTFCMFL